MPSPLLRALAAGGEILALAAAAAAATYLAGRLLGWGA